MPERLGDDGYTIGTASTTPWITPKWIHSLSASSIRSQNLRVYRRSNLDRRNGINRIPLYVSNQNCFVHHRLRQTFGRLNEAGAHAKRCYVKHKKVELPANTICWPAREENWLTMLYPALWILPALIQATHTFIRLTIEPTFTRMFCRFGNQRLLLCGL